MKITIDVDITPRELRVFFGLPDVKPLQDEMLEHIQEKMHAGVDGFDALSLMKPMLPAHMQSLDAVQKAFWQALTGGKTTVSETDAEETDSKPVSAKKTAAKKAAR